MLLSIMTLFLSILMAVHTLSQMAMVGCGVGSSCDQVLSSSWSRLFGFIPVGALAAGIYLAFIVILIFIDRPDTESDVVVLSVFILKLFCGAIIGSALWFTALQMWIIHAFCPYCMATHGCGVVLSVLTLWCLKGQTYDEGSVTGGKTAGKTNGAAAGVLWTKGWRAFLVGLAAAALLASLQAVTSKSELRFQTGHAQSSLPVADFSNAPLIGNPDAKHLITVIFDFQCSHCRKLHPLLRELAKGGEWAFLTCPTPLSSACNPYVPHGGVDRFAGSCDLSRLALALWYVDASLYEAFDEILFDFDSDNWYPMAPDEAYAQAAALIGSEEALNRALENPDVEHSLHLYYDIFGRSLSGEHAGVPRLIYSDRWLVPETTDLSELETLLQDLVSTDLQFSIKIVLMQLFKVNDK